MSSFQNPYKALLADYPGRIFSFEDCDADLCAVRRLASGADPLYCEIGSGSGGFLLELAKRNPMARYFGFELRYKRTVRTIQKALAWGIENVYVLNIKAAHLDQVFSPGSLNGAYINFPEPWQRPKWRKHQVLGSGLLQTLSSLLRPGGFLSIKSDHGEYLSTFLAQAEQFPQFRLRDYTADLYQSPYLAENISTEFERMFCHKQFKIHYARLEFVK